MGRIDEALRRTGNDNAVAERLTGREAVFQSAWSVPETSPGTRGASAAALEPVPEQGMSEPSSAITGFASAWQERLATGPEADPLLVEQFRRLAATLYHAQAANGIKIVMVTSASPSDGKTTTAVNLALVLSESYRRRVLLIDADLRRPSIANLTGLTDSAGLSETLRARTEQKLALVPMTPLLTLLPAGQPIPDPISALTSPRMRRILDEAAAGFDWVIIDAPPIGSVADAGLLAEMVDGTLFVVRASHTQYPLVRKAIDSIGADRLLGVVLNGAESVSSGQYEHYYGGTAATLPSKG